MIDKNMNFIYHICPRYWISKVCKAYSQILRETHRWKYIISVRFQHIIITTGYIHLKIHKIEESKEKNDRTRWTYTRPTSSKS